MKTVVISNQEQQKNLNLVTRNNNCGKSVSGRITDEFGVAIKDATISAVNPNFEPLVHTTSDCNGEYTVFIGVCAQIRLLVSKEGYKTIDTGIISSETQNFMLFSEGVKTSILKGKVLYCNCKPASGLRVRLTSADYNRCVVSAQDGTYIFANVPPGNYVLTVDGNDCEKKTACVYVEKNKEYKTIPDMIITKIDIGATLHGKVTDCYGKAINNAVVLLVNKSTKAIVAHTTTNQDGIYFFGELTLGTYYVEAYY